VLDSAWTAEVERFWMLASDEAGAPKAAVFQPEAYRGQSVGAQIWNLLRQAVGGGFKPEHGLMLTKTTYDRLGGHDAGSTVPEAQLIRKIGRKHIAVLRAGISGGEGPR
jgi:hypothetical protein